MLLFPNRLLSHYRCFLFWSFFVRYGYDHLILKIEWAKESAARDPSHEATQFRSGYGKALAQDTDQKVTLLHCFEHEKHINQEKSMSAVFIFQHNHTGFVCVESYHGLSLKWLPCFTLWVFITRVLKFLPPTTFSEGQLQEAEESFHERLY